MWAQLQVSKSRIYEAFMIMTLKQIRNNVLNFMDNVCVFRVQGVVHCGHFYQADCCLVQAIARRMYMASGETALALLLMVQELVSRPCLTGSSAAHTLSDAAETLAQRWANVCDAGPSFVHRLLLDGGCCPRGSFGYSLFYEKGIRDFHPRLLSEW